MMCWTREGCKCRRLKLGIGLWKRKTALKHSEVQSRFAIGFFFFFVVVVGGESTWDFPMIFYVLRFFSSPHLRPKREGFSQSYFFLLTSNSSEINGGDVFFFSLNFKKKKIGLIFMVSSDS